MFEIIDDEKHQKNIETTDYEIEEKIIHYDDDLNEDLLSDKNVGGF